MLFHALCVHALLSSVGGLHVFEYYVYESWLLSTILMLQLTGVLVNHSVLHWCTSRIPLVGSNANIGGWKQCIY